MMLVAYQNVAADTVRFLRGHPRTGSVIISLAGAGVLGKVVLYFWYRHLSNKKRQDRQQKAKANINEVAENVAEVKYCEL